MQGIFFEIDYWPLLLVLILSGLLLLLNRWRRRFADPHFVFSDLDSFKKESTLSTKYAHWPEYLLWAVFVAFVCAFVDPRFLIDKKLEQTGQTAENWSAHRERAPDEGIAIYLVLDQSGSMKENVPAVISGKQVWISKMDLLKQMTKKFIQGDPETHLQGRPNDLIGLVFFARAAKVMAPLTLDHAAILKELDQYGPVKDIDQEGTSLGYAIFKTANLIAATRHYAQELIEKGEPAYTIKNSIIILITDGMQDPNPLDKGKRLRNMDVPEAAAFAKDNHVRLYTVNVDPALATEEFAPYRHIMQRASESTGGHFYMVDNTKSLEDIYQDIDKLEKSVLPQTGGTFAKDKRPDLYRRIALATYLIAVGLICLLAALLLETRILRRVP